MVIDEKETHPDVATRRDVPIVYDRAGGGQRLESCHGVVRRIDSETNNDPAATQETL